MTKFNRHIALYSIVVLLLLAFSQCKQKPPKVDRDKTITAKNAVTKLYVDSMELEKYITEAKIDDSAAVRLRNFYNSRNFQFAWISEHGLAEQAKSFSELDKQYINTSRDSTAFDQQLHKRLDGLIDKDTTILKVSPALAKLELQLTEHFFNFVTNAYGGKLNPSALQWFIPRKKVDAVALLDSLVAKKGKDLASWEPVNDYYKTLNAALIKWNGLQKTGNWEPIRATKAKYKLNDSDTVVSAIKMRLAQYGNLAATDTSALYNDSTVIAVKKAQKQFGMVQTGVVDKSLIKALNVPIQQRIEQMLVNLERMRWIPLFPEDKVILVNIPEYKLHVFENKKEVINMGIVVGKSAHQTVIFSNTLKNIVFSPYWNVPPSIVKAEILPNIRRNRNYLAQSNMEQNGTADGLPVIRQKPGNNNSLGRVKFLFPNVYNIYLHDTPAKSLFQENARAFSHGCIRLAAPKQLANYLLSDRPDWTSDKIDKAMKLNKETWVTLKKPVPVFITYFTSWVSKDGSLNFRDDIYGHDAKMRAQLFKTN